MGIRVGIRHSDEKYLPELVSAHDMLLVDFPHQGRGI